MATIVEFPDRSELAKEAAEWLIRLDADAPPTDDELQALREWLRRSPAHREELESMAALWGRINVLTELAVPLGHASRLAARSHLARAMISMPLAWRRSGLLVASFAAMSALIFVLFARGPGADPWLATNGLYATAVGQQNTTTLADGSQVVLNTNSQIQVDYSGGYRRVYLLQGEALFTVAKNADRPFRVYAGNNLIEALGTAFSVYVKGEDVDVTVKEGRVSLAAMTPSGYGSAEPVASGSTHQNASESTGHVRESPTRSLGVLSAGQGATIRTPAIETSAGRASVLEELEPIAPEELARRLAWREGVLMFSGETLEKVVKELGRYTTVSIEIPDARIRSMRVGGRFPVGETETMISTLETNFDLRVIRMSHNRVVLAPANP